MCYVNTSKDTFFVLVGIGGFWSSQLEMNFVSALAWDGFDQHVLRYIVCSGSHVMCLLNTSWHTICELPCMGGFGQHNLRYIFCFRWLCRVLVNSSWETFCDLAGIGGIWSEKVEISFMSSPAWDMLGQHMWICILFPRWDRRGLFSTCWDTLCDLAVCNRCHWRAAYSDLAGFVWLGLFNTCYILNPLCNERGLLNQWCDKFCVLTSLVCVWSTHLEKHFVSSLSGEVFGQLMLRYILCPRFHNTSWNNFFP